MHTETELRFGAISRGVRGQKKRVGFAGSGNGFAALHKRSCDHRLASVILCAVMKPDERSPACR